MHLCRCNQVKMTSLGWALIQYDWYPYKTREVWTQKHVQREDDGKIAQDVGHVTMEAKRVESGCFWVVRTSFSEHVNTI